MSLSSQPDSRASTLSQPLVGNQAGFSDYFELTKPRLSFLSILTALVGYLAADAERNLLVLGSLLVGTSLAAGGAAALNQWMEHESDARMARTRNRPVPAGVVSPYAALAFGIGLSCLGSLVLFLGANTLSATLAILTIVTYIFAYTPLKKVTVHNTLVGAVPGAIPPLIGWAAATGALNPLGWMLFAILFLWQLPHFYAIAWMHRNDYQQAGYRMLPQVDPSGRKTARDSLVYTLALVACSLLPLLPGFTSWLYGGVALILGTIFTLRAWDFLNQPDQRDRTARALFLTSILYLPVLLLSLVLDVLLLQ